MNKERMNTQSDELQTSVMNCIKCGKVYKSNIISSYCEECSNKMNKKLSPIKSLTCCVCGELTKGRQWFNRDTGYGLCPKCADYVKTKQTPEENQSYYGIEGIHYNVEGNRMEHTPYTAQEELLGRFNIERCLECNCCTGDDTEYKDYSNKTIIVCAQCGYEWYTECMEEIK